MIPEQLKEDIRVDILGRIHASGIFGMRSDALLRSIKKDPRFAQLTANDLAAEALNLATHGWVAGAPEELAPAIVTYKLTDAGKEYCYTHAIGD